MTALRAESWCKMKDENRVFRKADGRAVVIPDEIYEQIRKELLEDKEPVNKQILTKYDVLRRFSRELRSAQETKCIRTPFSYALRQTLEWCEEIEYEREVVLDGEAKDC